MTSIPVLRCKPEVQFARIDAGGFRILSALDNATKVLGSDLWISCGSEGHAAGDPHTSGNAYDVSVQHLTVPVLLTVKRYLEQVLGARFTVLYEVPLLPSDPDLAAIAYVNGKATAPHFHVQTKKGTVYPPPEQVVA